MTSSVPPEHRRTRRAATTRPEFPREDVQNRPEGDVPLNQPHKAVVRKATKRGDVVAPEPSVQAEPAPSVPVPAEAAPAVPWPANVPVPPAVPLPGTPIGVGEHYAPTIAERCVMDLCGTQSKDLVRVQAAIDEAVGLVRGEYLNITPDAPRALPPLDLANMTPKEKVAARKQRAKEEKDLKAQVKKDKAAQAKATAAAKKSAAQAKAAKAKAAKKGTSRKK
jgi:hypothetical protein